MNYQLKISSMNLTDHKVGFRIYFSDWSARNKLVRWENFKFFIFHFYCKPSFSLICHQKNLKKMLSKLCSIWWDTLYKDDGQARDQKLHFGIPNRGYIPSYNYSRLSVNFFAQQISIVSVCLATVFPQRVSMETILFWIFRM